MTEYERGWRDAEIADAIGNFLVWCGGILFLYYTGAIPWAIASTLGFFNLGVVLGDFMSIAKLWPWQWGSRSRSND